MNKSERQLFLFRGLPGSGKSTAAATQENWDHRVLETDMFLKNKDGDFEFDAARLPWAHDQCFKMALEFLDMGFDVSVANHGAA
jgi:predicted kinase